jgi:ubiquinone/menaquinone biosynthesis C-methylase UbiE
MIIMPLFRSAIPGTRSRLAMVDHEETYGRTIIDQIVQKMTIHNALDLGCGKGADLHIIKKHHPQACLTGIDTQDYCDTNGIQRILMDIEKDTIPYTSESMDIVIANQILEHVKEIYWIHHEVFRVLNVGGVFLIGVPNVLACHNRILGIFGGHPTCAKLISAHVRIFSKKDTFLFYHEIAAKFSKIVGFYGAQFYPFPQKISRILARRFPTLAVTNFYLIQKTAPYNDEFLTYRQRIPIETNYYLGN